jgi:hypothetical protein
VMEPLASAEAVLNDEEKTERCVAGRHRRRYNRYSSFQG